MTTAIQWTDETWNPVTGYALKMAGRLKLMGQAGYQNDGDPRTSGPGFAVTLHPDQLGKPLRWRKPRRVFVNSMSDLFHEDVPEDFIARVWERMVETPRHTYQVLTKRPQRMARMLGPAGIGFYAVEGPVPCPQPNIWLGTSVEDQRYANIRIPQLLATPAAVRFLSCEPLLGPVTFRWAKWAPVLNANHLDGLRPLDWVIVGGESGPGARPMDLGWVRTIIKECREADVAVFVKQLGSRWGRTHHDIDTWPEDLRVREWPT